MRTIKLASALITLLALTSIAAATANAAETLWQWLPGTTGTTFTDKSGEAILEGTSGASIKCSSSTSTGEITAEKTLGLVTIEFKGCKAESIAAVNSLGDPKEIILTHVELHNCIISTTPLDAGILFKPLPLHLEIPLVSKLISVAGSFVALVEPIKEATKEFKLNIKQTKGVQEIKKCEGGSEELLTSETNENGKPEQSAEKVTAGTFTFKEPQEAMA